VVSGPNSYTGEDLAEFHVHGSRAVINALHSTIGKIKNCRLAEPGEFTKRAFQNGKINLLEAESVADLISSETEIQRKQALKIMSGKSSDQYNSWREKLLKILSHIEAKIDFPDEDLPKDIFTNIIKQYKNEFEINEIIENYYFDTPGNLVKYFLALAKANINITENTLKCIFYFIEKYKNEKTPEALSFISLFIEKFYNELCLNNNNNLNCYLINQSKILKQIDEMKKFNLNEKNIFIWIKDILQNEAK